MRMEMAENDQKKVEVRTVSLYSEDWLEVDVLARASGSGASAALRRIIREWCKLREPGTVESATERE